MANHYELLRHDYDNEALLEADAAPDPVDQFRAWFEAGMAASLPQPDAMVLATAAAAGRPSIRAVIMRSFDERGFVFATNYQSRKGRELAENPQAAGCFLWLDLHRQVRINGSIVKLTDTESDAIFKGRLAGARIAAVVSPQSDVIGGRDGLERRFAELESAGEPPERPSSWGGYRLVPAEFEFWQGRKQRLHDRLRYTRRDGGWDQQRLAP